MQGDFQKRLLSCSCRMTNGEFFHYGMFDIGWLSESSEELNQRR